MSGFVLHPEALTDLDEIWEYIAAENPSAADGVLEEIYATQKRESQNRCASLRLFHPPNLHFFTRSCPRFPLSLFARLIAQGHCEGAS